MTPFRAHVYHAGVGRELGTICHDRCRPGIENTLHMFAKTFIERAVHGLYLQLI